MSNSYGYGGGGGGGGGGYSNTTYGAQNAANEGGGFMNGSQQGSQDSPAQSKTYGQDSLRPITIKQIMDATQAHSDADFKIDGAEVTVITFVGQVNSISTKATNILYKVDDGTGIIDVMSWVNGDDPKSQESVAKEGEYIRVFGRLKTFNDKRSVTAHMLRPVPDFNEVSYHLLEATVTHLYFTRGPPGGDVKAEPGNSGMFVDSWGGNNNAGGAKPAGAKLPHKIGVTGRKVYDLLQNAPQNNEGLHVHQIAQQLGIQSNDVFKAGDELLGEGLIYTTVDDETWAVLEY
ncbi:hypothetical protein BJ875DRAFT_461085 [Amylocarpus encephaloides]|uniref:Replication protein A C-terminal domain-containing protein n=1 Tax=Amylocarpus encephaloides TaxID=45428 RepID=A0A9P8C5F0_9HELO|nr:hypothetical protein BJ875DRAFT_461085 [Amylocarpus encephaloides]